MQRYISSRDPQKKGISSQKAIITGLAEDGGLYTPYPINFYIDPAEISGMTYQEMASKIMMEMQPQA